MSRTTIPDELSLQARQGLPDDLLALLAKYPRETWPHHANLGELARFWLSRHDMFRELCGVLAGAAEELGEQRIEAAPFRAFFAPRMRFFLQQLEAHHRIEDGAYFPAFMAAESRLKRGFEILENDHEILHMDLLRLREAGSALLAALASDHDARLRSAEATSRELSLFLEGLRRHLHDEEDLIVPLILERGEAGLGIG
ncbi:hemerythrin domain-containing protein [Afifella pfennigii]|uniref:hemerythrin domain-containing protein n=1 Tax=Afifella pfennigii TaxID=209897 RepID=UPI0005554194|nr:hemerythrin domain-containing protein [Afifella pfennigii]